MTIFLIVILAIILLKNQYSSLLLQNASYGMPALIKRQNVENLFLGSSMFRQGIDILELNAAFPDKNYILAYNGNQPVTEYLELKNLLENDVKIKNLTNNNTITIKAVKENEEIVLDGETREVFSLTNKSENMFSRLEYTKDFLYLEYAENHIVVEGNCQIEFQYQCPMLIV